MLLLVKPASCKQVAPGEHHADDAWAATGRRRPTGKVVGVIKRNWRSRGYAGSLLPPKEGSRSGAVSWLVVPVEKRFPYIRIQTHQVLVSRCFAMQSRADCGYSPAPAGLRLTTQTFYRPHHCVHMGLIAKCCCFAQPKCQEDSDMHASQNLMNSLLKQVLPLLMSEHLPSPQYIHSGPSSRVDAIPSSSPGAGRCAHGQAHRGGP